MQSLMASRAQRYQILFGIIAGPAPKPNMVHLQVLQAPAGLATPPIPLQHLLMEFSVILRIKPQPRALGEESVHEAFPASSTNCFF